MRFGNAGEQGGLDACRRTIFGVGDTSGGCGVRCALCVLAVVQNVGRRMREMARKLEDAAEDNERRMMLSSLALVDARHHSRAESERAFNPPRTRSSPGLTNAFDALSSKTYSPTSSAAGGP